MVKNSHIRSAYNINEVPDSTFQVSGVTQWPFNTTATRTYGSGVDPSGLGRWVWSSYRGRNGLSLKVYTFYRPAESDEYMGAAKQQQIRYFSSIGRHICPIKAF